MVCNQSIHVVVLKQRSGPEKSSLDIFALYNVVTSVPDRNELVRGCVGSPGVFPVGLEWSGSD
jgi:hypothetical protein